MVDENRPEAGWGSRFVRGFWRSWSWLVSVAGFLVVVVPDLANLALANVGTIATVFPEMSLRQKAIILLSANVLSIMLRPVKQPKAFRPDEGTSVPVVSVKIPESIIVEPGGAPLEVEIERHDRARAEPGPPG